MNIKILILTLFVVTAQASGQHPKSSAHDIDEDLMVEYLIWGDTRILSILENLSEEEFSRPFNELSGNIHSKTAHILSIYDYFIAIFRNQPHKGFPSLDHLSKQELMTKWKECLKVWQTIVNDNKNQLVPLSLAKNQRVNSEHIFLDLFAHTIYHRGQLITFLRLIGKTKEDIHPRDANTDYLNFIFSNRMDYVHPPEN